MLPTAVGHRYDRAGTNRGTSTVRTTSTERDRPRNRPTTADSATDHPWVLPSTRLSCVVVRSRGRGFPQDLLRYGPRGFHVGVVERGTGNGLGLTIASGQTGLLGAELRLANAPDGGAVATVHLPDSRPRPRRCCGTAAHQCGRMHACARPEACTGRSSKCMQWSALEGEDR